MQPGNFSRSVVVREWPSRHCFISLPRPWASLTLPAPTPTFNLEVSEDRNILLSWAGDMHNPNPGEENTVLVGREVLRSSGISDGEFGMISQVQVPPPCSSVTVHVGSLDEWQDLALNAEVAQSAFLSQVRVLGLGQSLPLWLEGGVRVTLTVTQIVPPRQFVILQPMTQVEVLPPLELDKSEEFCPINFTPTDIDSMKHKNVKEQKYLDNNCFELLMKYMTFKLHQHRIAVDSPLRKEFCYGYRVLPIPKTEEASQLCDILSNHPSLVIVSKQSLVFVDCQSQICFIARIKKIDSPKEKAEKSSASREDDKAGETKQLDSMLASNNILKSSDKFCTVIVWENFVEKEKNTEFIEKMNVLIKGNACIMSDCLRRLMKMETFSVIELNNNDINLKTLPVTVDVSPLLPFDSSSNKIVCGNLKRVLKDVVEVTDVVINTNTLCIVTLEGKNIDVLVTIRDGVPLKLSKESVFLLETTQVSIPSNIPHITCSVADLDVMFTAKFQYVGNEKVLSQLQQHILLGSGVLMEQYKGVPQFALLHGSRGSGKTSLVETVAQNLSGFPYYLHFQIVKLKQLKGKKMETVEKKLQLVFREAIFRKPSVIVLEDLDSLAPSKGIEDQEAGPLYDHTMQMVNMLKGLLDHLLEFCLSDDNLFPNDNPKQGTVTLVATSILRTSVHPNLVNPQGCHYFPCSFGIPVLESEGRVKALSAMINAHLENYALHHSIRSHECCINSLQKEANNSDLCRKHYNIERNLAVKLTESFVLPDLSHLALRTFLQARHRWEGKAKRSGCCIKCGNNFEIENQNTSNSSLLLSSSVTETKDNNANVHSIRNNDLEVARKGYTPLALQGLELSEKKASTTMQVGGLAEACKTLKEMLTWPSTYPNLFSKVKLRLRSGVLLYGPPGCGKTLIANSIAASCQLNFISVKGPELLSKYIGASEQAVRDAFERASSAKPCVLFFDEFESIAPRRGHDSTGVTDRVVNQLLTQMDGVEGLVGVYILAATSRPDLIDPALLRPGRLDKCVFCPMPSVSDREDILKILSQGVNLGEEIDWSEIASATDNYSGADLQSLLSTAQILVAQEALGEELYKGVFPFNENENQSVSEEMLSDELVDVSGEGEESVVQVVLEKEKKVKFSQRNSVSRANVNQEDTDRMDSYSDSLFQSSGSHTLVEDHETEQSVKKTFKVYKQHIKASLKEVKPSVTSDERQKYEHLYSGFSKSRDGNFGKHIPGKRATLA